MCISSPSLQIYIYFPSRPFAHIHIYVQKHYNIMVLLNYRIRSTVWLQLTFVLAKPFYFLQTTTIGGAESIQGHLCKPLLRSNWAEAPFCWDIPTNAALASACRGSYGKWRFMIPSENRRNTGLWDSPYFCTNRKQTHLPEEFGWSFFAANSFFFKPQ